MQVRVLGTLEVEDDQGRPVAVTGAKQRALLAVLAAEVGHAVPADRLIDLLWGDAPLGDAGNALQHQVSRLRKALGAARVASHGPGYALDLPPDAVDAALFARLAAEGRAALRQGDVAAAVATLRRADGLWRGVPFAGLDDGWARAEATRLEQLRLDVLEERIGAELAQGRHHDLVGELEGLVGEHPYREPFWAQLMTALYRCGRQTDALAAFQRAREVLADAQGLDPGPDLRAVEAAILRHDPGLAWTALPATEAAEAADLPQVTSATVTRARGNLPVPLTSFIGRDEQLTEVRALVDAHRLVTLTGTGGAGKTRLAIEVASSLQDRQDELADGTWMVELAPLADPADVPSAVASALAAGDPARVTLLAESGAGDRVVDFLRSRRMLLVLDNCEHLFPGVSEWTDAVLAAAPGVHILATSREPLGIIGEVQWPVPTLAESEAVQLFAERANRVGPFRLTSDTTAAVADACRHLDGLPLAIELAAARTKALPVAHIAAELGDRFRLLVSTSRTAPLRQRTLQAALDWSYELLDDPERELLGLVSVFDGGCSLDAVERLAVAGAALDARASVDLLTGLVDKSLVVAQPDAFPGPRYDLLETIRAYGRAQLALAARLDEVRRAHRAWVIDLVEEAEEGLLSRDHRLWLRRLEQERDNIRAAFDSAMDDGAWSDALRITSALWWFWSVSAGRGEGRAWLESALTAADADAAPSPPASTAPPNATGPASHDRSTEPPCGTPTASPDRPDPGDPTGTGDSTGTGGSTGGRGAGDGGVVDPALRVKALTALCYLAGQGLDIERAIAAGEEAVALAAELGVDWTLAWAKQSLALTLQLAGEPERAGGLLAEARVVMDAAGDHWRVAGNDLVLCVRGVLGGDLDAVDRASREVLHRAAVAGYEPFVGWGHLVRAHVAEHRGDLDGAVLSYERALASARRLELGHDTAFALVQLGRVALLADDPVRAEAALGEAVAVAEAAEAEWFVALARVHQATLARGRGDEAGARALLEAVAEWGETVDPAFGPAAFFLILGGDPRVLAAVQLG